MRTTRSERWGLLELADAGVAVLDCEHKTPPDAGYGHPYIAIPNLVDGTLVLTNVRRITAEDLRAWTRRTRPRAGDIIVTRRARVGDTAVVPDGLDCAIGQNLVILRSDGRDVDQCFLRYATRGPLWGSEVNRLRNVGAVFDSLNVRDIARIRIPIPRLADQRAIAAVLGAFDDKIDSNRRLAALLEQAAAELFRARFVDFVGVEEFEDSEIGRIPRGWQVGRLTDFVEQLRERGSANAPYIGLDDMPRGSTVLTAWKHEGAPTGQSVRFQRGDILFGKLRPYFKKVGVASLDGRCSAEIVVLRPRGPESFGFSIGHLTSARFFEHCEAVSTGTRMPRAEWKLAGELAVGYPAATELAEFNALVATTYDAILGLTHENHTLAAIRDALLPKLISGAIRVTSTSDPVEATETAREQVAATKR